MKDNVLTSKIVANSTEATWSQVYSTLNLCIVISIEDQDAQSSKTETIASYGKTVLEKLQREFFAIDKKRLFEVKGAVQKTVETIDPNIKYSIVLANIVKNVLYIITAGPTTVVIRRGEKTGIVAQGEKNKINSFSGIIENNDKIILQTEGFSNKLPLEKLARLLSGKQVSEIAENIAPIIHGNPKGTEAAILIQYEGQPLPEDLDQQEEETDQEVGTNRINITLPPVFKLGIKNILVKIFKSRFLSRKRLLILAAIVLLIILMAEVILLDQKRNRQKMTSNLSENIISSAKDKYSQAQTFLNLNKNLALQKLNEAKDIINGQKDKFAQGSPERRDIDALLVKIDEQIHKLESGNLVSDQKILFQRENSSSIKQIGQITLKGEDFVVADGASENIITLSKENGKMINSFKAPAKGPTLITANAIEIYLLADNGVYKIGKKDGKAQKIIDLAGGDYTGIDTYLGNIYLLNSKNKDIEKYTPAAYKKSEYLQEGVKIVQAPLSMAIDGSVWILLDNGDIKKYTKGKEEAFEVKNLPKSISTNSVVYTEADFKNLYILDKNSQKIIIIAKTGEYQSQYDLGNLGDITTFAVDEANKKIFAASGSKVYSFGFNL